MASGARLRPRQSRGLSASNHQAVIFIDEVDSILSQRREGEQEGTIRVKNEILVQMDGVSNADANERLLLVGATNRPQELDEAARRRLQKRLLIPLPDAEARKEMLLRGLKGVSHSLSETDVAALVAATDGYSGSDMAAVGREAAMGPCRDEGFERALMAGLDVSSVRPVNRQDYDDALCQVRASVSEKDLQAFDDWNKQYGSFANRASLASGK